MARSHIVGTVFHSDETIANCIRKALMATLIIENIDTLQKKKKSKSKGVLVEEKENHSKRRAQ